MNIIRVVLVDDHPVVLAGLAALLQDTQDISVIGTASSGKDALSIIGEKAPDLAIIDISLPDVSGGGLAEQIQQLYPDIHVIALTVHESRAYVQSLMQSGARGYVLKRAAAEDLVRAIRAVAAGGLYLDPVVAEQALPSIGANDGSQKVGTDDLSPREKAVLKTTAQGFSNKEIAARLEISIKSVETYKARAAAKLNLHSRADIVRYGVACGWLDAPEIL